MKKKLRHFLSIFLILWLTNSSVAFPFPFWEKFMQKLEAILKQVNEEKPFEKVYLQLDKPLYKPNEDIWLKAYIRHPDSYLPTLQSDILYVELINPQGQSIQKLKLPIRLGTSFGDFHLSGDIAGGLYTIKAYTKWLQNFGEENYFSKTIFVQKVVQPNMLLSLDFVQKGYGRGDWVEAEFEAKDLKNEVIANQAFHYKVQIAGKTYIEKTDTTNPRGKAIVKFQLPQNLQSPDALLNIMMNKAGRYESIARSIPITLNQVSLHFFPEGGDMIENLQGKVAFKATNVYGKPVDVKGIVVNAKQEKIASFSSFHRGMGAFDFLPKTNETYQVKITKPTGIDKVYTLPQIQKEGMIMQVLGQNKKSVKLSYQSSKPQELLLVAQSGSKILFSKKLQASKKLNTLNIPIHNFPVGIARLTLFDEKEIPQAERLVFLHADKNMKVEIETNQKTYSPREKVEVKVKTSDDLGNPISANLSVAVVDERMLKVADDKQAHILAKFLLTSELKGKIEEPNFYFDKTEAKAKQGLDYVMLTHGWRRFEWQKILSDTHHITVNFLPEKLGIVSGRVLDAKTHKPIKNATVTLIELSQDQKGLEVKTNKNGSFMFLNINHAMRQQLITYYRKKKIILVLDEAIGIKGNSLVPIWSDKQGGLQIFSNEKLTHAIQIPNTQGAIHKNLDKKVVKLESQLNEVVVNAYREVSKVMSTSSISTVNSRRINQMPVASFDQILQGQAPGILVQAGSGRPGASPAVAIRGINGISTSAEPLYVVDGVQINSSDFATLNPNNFASVSVLKDASATAIYGSRGANGVIVIQTNNFSFNNKYYTGYNKDYFYKPPREVPYNKGYHSIVIRPADFTKVREFYNPDYSKVKDKKAKERFDFRSTVFWKPDVQTDEKGEASFSFYHSDDISTFEILAEGISSNGKIGRAKKSYHTIKPFFLEAKLPAYFCMGDTLEIPVRLENNTEKTLSDILAITLPQHLKLVGASEREITLHSKEVKVVKVKCIALHATVKGTDLLPEKSSQNIVFEWQGKKFRDKITLPIQIQAKGFPRTFYESGNEMRKTFAFEMNEVIDSTQKINLTVYLDILSDLMAGVEGIFRQPSGCFEQVSSSTYPNVLALQYLKEAGEVNPAVEAKAIKYIKMGYKKLAGYETAVRGFEWFGKTPPHLALTAYGLMEFTDMQKVYAGVNEKMLDRTKKWLLKQRNGEGGFKYKNGKYEHFGKSVMDAYVLYALSEAGVKEVDFEYQTQYQKAVQNNDGYVLALLANTALNFGKQADADNLLKRLKNMMLQKGLGNLEATLSVYNSRGKYLQIETAALIGMALLKEKEIDKTLVLKIADYLIAQRNYGRFGTTQGTILSLKFLTGFAKLKNKEKTDGTIIVSHQGKVIKEQFYSKDQRGKLILDLPTELFSNGRNDITIEFQGKEGIKPLPYTFQASWQTYTPKNFGGCPLRLETKLAQKESKTQETVRINIVLENQSKESQAMSMAVVGIPSGLSLQPWQLKELTEQNKIDFYEIYQNYVVFYYRGMEAKERKEINLDLKAEIAGSYKAPASVAYLYYQDEDKYWTGGTEVLIR